MAGAVSAVPGRGRLLFAATAGNALTTTPAVHAVFGTFLVPLSESFGWSRASISGVLAVLALTSAVVYPLAGRYADAHGARRMLLFGNILFALSVAALAFTTASLVQFYLTFLAIGVFGALPSTAIFSKVVAEWFGDNRGTALGVSAGAGNGIGSVMFPVVAALLISAFGWRAGYLGIGAIILCVGFPILFLFLRDAPGFGEDSVADPDMPGITGLSVTEAAGQRSFWLILAALAAGAGISTAIFSHVVPIVGDRGFGLAIGTTVVSAFALTGSTWQIVTGRALDRTASPRVVAPMYAMAIIGLLLLEFGGAVWMLMLGGLLLGVALGTQFAAMPYFIARYFGLRHFGAILGVMYSGVIAAQGITPVLLDAWFDTQGSYRGAVVIAAACLALGTLLLLLLPGYGRAPAPAREAAFSQLREDRAHTIKT